MADPFVTASALRDAIVRGETTAEAAVAAALDRIALIDRGLHAFHTVDADGALARARALDRERPAAPGPLHGVPIALKDNIATRGVPTTAGSRILADYIPPYDATVVRRLAAAG